MLGSCATQLPSIDVTTMRTGPKLSYEDRLSLCLPVTDVEIDMALKGIDDSKAPGIDGFNAVFFKQTWSVIKHDMYASIKEFCPIRNS